MDLIQIRTIRSEDVDDIIDLYSAIIRKKVNIGFIESIKEQSKNGNNQIICYVADAGGSIVGFIIGHILIPGFGMEKSAWIATLGVHPGYMGRDIGKLLAEKLFKLYKSIGINKVYTSVLWDSTDVLSFFKKIGFERSKFIELQKELD